MVVPGISVVVYLLLSPRLTESLELPGLVALPSPRRLIPWWTGSRVDLNLSLLRPLPESKFLWCGVEGYREVHQLPPPGSGAETYYGFNNQRQQMLLGFWLALGLRRPLLLSRYLTNIHDPVGLGPTHRDNLMSNIFDLQALRQAIPVEETLHQPAAVLAQNNPKLLVIHPTKMHIFSELLSSNAALDHRNETLRVPLQWGFSDFVIQFADAKEHARYDEYHRRFLHYRSEYLDIAEAAVALLKPLSSATPRLGYSCVHARVGDREPTPVLNCSEANFMPQLDKSGSCYWQSSGQPVRLSEAVLRHSPRSLGRLLIITNDVHDTHTRDLLQACQNAGVDSVVFSEVLSQQSSFHTRWHALASLQRAIVEQIICAYGDHFFGTLGSTFDEFIYAIRRWLKRPQSREEYDLFQYKVAWHMAYIRLHSKPGLTVDVLSQLSRQRTKYN